MTDSYFNDPTEVLEAKGQILEFYHTISGTSVFFKAFLTQYSEDFNCQWNSQPVFGRPDPIQTYQGTSRSLSLGWKVPASSINEAEENLVKTSTLSRMLYPEYSKVDNASTISKGPLIKIKFANLIYDGSRGPGGDVRTCGLLGVITSFSWAPSLAIEDGFFDPGNKLFPKLITLSVRFDVLHQHTLGWEKREATLVDTIDNVRGPAGGNNVPVEGLADETSRKAGRRYLDYVNEGRRDPTSNVAPFWGSDAALFPWSSGVQRANTRIGNTTASDVKKSRESNILKENK